MLSSLLAIPTACLLLVQLDSFTGRLILRHVDPLIIIFVSIPVTFAFWGPFIFSQRHRLGRRWGLSDDPTVLDRAEKPASMPAIPVWLGTLMVASVLMGLVSAAIGLPLSFSGQPIQANGRYFLSSHGKLTEVSHSSFEDHQVSELRAFTGVESLFIVVAMGYVWSVANGYEP